MMMTTCLRGGDIPGHCSCWCVDVGSLCFQVLYFPITSSFAINAAVVNTVLARLPNFADDRRRHLGRPVCLRFQNTLNLKKASLHSLARFSDPTPAVSQVYRDRRLSRLAREEGAERRFRLCDPIQLLFLPTTTAATATTTRTTTRRLLLFLLLLELRLVLVVVVLLLPFLARLLEHQ